MIRQQGLVASAPNLGLPFGALPSPKKTHPKNTVKSGALSFQKNGRFVLRGTALTKNRRNEK